MLSPWERCRPGENAARKTEKIFFFVLSLAIRGEIGYNGITVTGDRIRKNRRVGTMIAMTNCEVAAF